MEVVQTRRFASFLQELRDGNVANWTVCATIAKEASVKLGLLNLFSVLSILLLVAVSQSLAQRRNATIARARRRSADL